MSTAVTEAPTTALTINTTRGELLPALEAVMLSAPKRPPVPILAGVLLDPVAGTLSTTDYEVTTSVAVAGLWGSGRAVLNAAALHTAVKTGGKTKTALASPVSLVIADGKATVTVSGMTVQLQTLPESEFPTLGHNLTAKVETVFTVDADLLRQSWDRVSVATATGRDCLPILESLHLTTESGWLTLASTDRYRLHESRVGVIIDASQPALDICVPVQVSKSLKHLSGPVTVSVGGDAITCRSAGLTVTIRLQAGEFPKITSIWHKDGADSFTCDRDNLLNAVKTLKSFRELNIPIRFRPNGDTLTSRIGTDNVVEGPHITCEGEMPEGFALNPNFLADLLNTLPVGQIRVTHAGPGRPLGFASDTAPGFRGLLMPVKFAE